MPPHPKTHRRAHPYATLPKKYQKTPGVLVESDLIYPTAATALEGWTHDLQTMGLSMNQIPNFKTSWSFWVDESPTEPENELDQLGNFSGPVVLDAKVQFKHRPLERAHIKWDLYKAPADLFDRDPRTKKYQQSKRWTPKPSDRIGGENHPSFIIDDWNADKAMKRLFKMIGIKYRDEPGESVVANNRGAVPKLYDPHDFCGFTLRTKPLDLDEVDEAWDAIHL